MALRGETTKKVEVWCIVLDVEIVNQDEPEKVVDRVRRYSCLDHEPDNDDIKLIITEMFEDVANTIAKINMLPFLRTKVPKKATYRIVKFEIDKT